MDNTQGSETKTLTIGDRVRWSSQASGFTRQKEGEIIHVIEPNEHLPEEVLSHGRAEFDTARIDGKRRFVVKVFPTPKSKPKLYCPLPSGLSRVVRDEAAA